MKAKPVTFFAIAYYASLYQLESAEPGLVSEFGKAELTSPPYKISRMPAAEIMDRPELMHSFKIYAWKRPIRPEGIVLLQQSCQKQSRPELASLNPDDRQIKKFYRLNAGYLNRFGTVSCLNHDRFGSIYLNNGVYAHHDFILEAGKFRPAEFILPELARHEVADFFARAYLALAQEREHNVP